MTKYVVSNEVEEPEEMRLYSNSIPTALES